MGASEGERLCQEAQVYYYDLLDQEETAVPAVVRHHVSVCSACQEQVRRLRAALADAQGPANAGACQDETIETLAQQFQLLDERVTCSVAKPLLPELAQASPRIRIPTPITVHVDHCPPCAGDLAALRGLHLTADQLRRLGRLLETGCIPAANPGREVRDAEDGPAPVISGARVDDNAGIACHDIAMTDLFDGVVPGSATPPRDASGARQKAILRHVRSCPVCLEKACTLRRTIGAIVARADSEIVTVYHAENDGEQAGGGAEGGHPYPVSVQVLHGPSDAAGGRYAARTAATAALRGVRRSTRPLATLAALLLVVVSLTLASVLRTTSSTASGTNVGDVDKILARIKNVQIVVRDQEAGVTQEFWIARRSGILAEKRKQDGVLYDLAHERKRTLASPAGPGGSERLSGSERDKARRFMANCLRDLMTGVSPDARLRRATGEIDGGVPEGLDVYELPSPSQARNSRWRDYRLVYIDRAGGLPRKMEFYRQKPGADRGNPVTTTTFTYPTEQAMDSALRTLFPAP